MNTTGYKRQRAEFQDLLYQNQRRVGSVSSDVGTVVPSGVQLGLGVKPAAIYRIAEQGSLAITGNDYDLAVNGKGFFMVELPSGDTAYTRAGTFQISQDGDLVTPDGFVVQPGITIPPDAVTVTVNASGEFWVELDGQVNPVKVGQLELANFANEAGIDPIGDNMYLETRASGQPKVAPPGAPGFGSIEQGALETSNVNVVTEITNLITAQRAYEMNSKVIQAADEMMSTISRLR
jgi:flagellar basal-body rod protein FlgG